MAKLNNWNQEEVEIQEGGFSNWEDGWYSLIITGADITIDKDGQDQVELTICAMTGKYEGKNRKLWLSIGSMNADVQRIAKSQLKQIAEACGINSLEDTDELNNKSLDIKFYTNKKGYQNIGEIRTTEFSGSGAAKQDSFESDLPDAFN